MKGPEYINALMHAALVHHENMQYVVVGISFLPSLHAVKSIGPDPCVVHVKPLHGRTWQLLTHLRYVRQEESIEGDLWR